MNEARWRLTLGMCLVASAATGAALISFSTRDAGASGDSVIMIDLPANDIVYDPITDKIFASVPSRAGKQGNSITEIDPHTGDVGESVFVGSEPDVMALSDDGQFIYVALDGSRAVRRYDVATRTAELEFSLDNRLASDLEVVPGNPHALAVAFDGGGVAVYDDGAARATEAAFPTAITFSSDPSLLYGLGDYQSDLYVMQVGADGVTALYTEYTTIPNFHTDIEFEDGLIYASTGVVVDPTTSLLVGTYASGGPFVPDSNVGRVFFLHSSSVPGLGEMHPRVDAFDMDAFTPVGHLPFDSIDANEFYDLFVFELLRWGEDGLAFTLYDSVVVVESSIVHGDPKPTMTATGTETPTRTPIRAGTPTRTQPQALVPGDVSCDRHVNSLDATLILQYQASLVGTLPCLWNGDVNQDGAVDAIDATILLQFVAGLIHSLPV